MKEMNNKPDIRERRLKFIYDALDSGNNKKAIQEADKVLKKDYSCTCAKALRILALYRHGKHADASQMAQSLVAAGITDESTLQAMTYYFRESHQLETIAQIYENASAHNPHSEDIMSTLFMAYVRILDHKNQQRVAMKLHKLNTTKNPYYFWAVMSTVMQGLEAGPEQSRKLFLPLAERMVKKYIDEGRLQTDCEVQLYLMILEHLGKWKEIDEALNHPMFLELIPDSTQPSVKRLKLQNYERMGESIEVVNICRDILAEEPDDWAIWSKLVKHGLKCDNHLDNMLEFLKKVQYEDARYRGPYLAEIHLIREGKLQRSDAELVSLFCEYFNRFQRKPVTASDLIPYLMLFEDKDELHAEILDKCAKCLPEYEKVEEAGEKPVKVFKVPADVVIGHLNLEQLRRGLHKSSDDREAYLARLCKLHLEGFQPGLLKTEYPPQDGFICLAAEEMYDAWVETEDDEWLWRSIVTLEAGLRVSPSNHYIMVRLVRLYGTLGAYLPALRLYDRMEVKQIMCDSVGYMISRLAIKCGQFANGTSLLNSFTKFFKVSRKDVTEYLTTAYKTGSFRKVPEFVGLSARLASSLESAFCNMELRYLHLLFTSVGWEPLELVPNLRAATAEFGCDPSVQPVALEELRDNRDFEIVPCYQPVQCSLKLEEGSFLDQDAQKEADKAAELRWIRFRSLLLRTLSWFARPVDQQEVETAQKLGELWTELVQSQSVLPEAVITSASPVRPTPHPNRPNACPLQIYVLGPKSAETDEQARDAGSLSKLITQSLSFYLQILGSENTRPPIEQLAAPLIAQIDRLTAIINANDVLDLSKLIPCLTCLVESTLILLHVSAVTQVSVTERAGGKRQKTIRPDQEWCQKLHIATLQAVSKAVEFFRAVCEKFSAENLKNSGNGEAQSKLSDMLMRQMGSGERATEIGALVEAARHTVIDSHAVSLEELRRTLETCLPISKQQNGK